jgi:hypothetical protein
VATHQGIGSLLWAGETLDLNLGLQDNSLALTLSHHTSLVMEYYSSGTEEVGAEMVQSRNLKLPQCTDLTVDHMYFLRNHIQSLTLTFIST